MAKTILKNGNKVGKLTLLYFKTYNKTTIINKLCYRCKDRQVDKWNKIEPHICFQQRYKGKLVEKGSLFKK